MPKGCRPVLRTRLTSSDGMCALLRRRESEREKRAVLAFVLAVLALVVGSGDRAVAHAVLISANPADGQRFEQPPRGVSLTFGESVEISVGGIRVFDDAGHDLSVGAPYHPAGAGNTVAVAVQPLQRGRYTVAWQVISADSHLVGGAYRFGVGVDVAPGEAPAAPAIDPLATWTLGLLRAITLAALVMALGLGAAAPLVLRASNRLSAPAIEFAAWCVAAAGVFADGATRIAFAGGTLLGLVSTRFGSFRLIEAIAALVAAFAVCGSVRRWRLLAGAAGVIVIAQVLSGHAPTGPLPVVGVATDAAHLLAAAVWVGALAWTVGAPQSVVARRTSALATCAVAVLAIAGVAEAARLVGSISGLVASDYGRLVLAKVALFIVMLAVASVARRRVRTGGDALAIGGTVRLELVLIALILGITGFLVNGRPPIDAPLAEAGPSQALRASFGVADARVAVTVRRVAEQRWHIDIASTGADGRPFPLDEASAELRETTRGVGPFALTILPSGRARAFSGDAELPFRGNWTLIVHARSGDFDEGTTIVSLPALP